MRFTKRQVPKQDGNSGSYLTIKDGEAIKVVFCGEIFEFYQSWPFGGEKQIFDKPTSGASPRFKVNLAIWEKNAFGVKVWEFGLPTYIQLSDINDVYPLESTKIQITRRGSAKATTYAILPLLKEPLSRALMAQIGALKLHILGQSVKPEHKAVKNHAPSSNEAPDDFQSEPWPEHENDGAELPF